MSLCKTAVPSGDQACKLSVWQARELSPPEIPLSAVQVGPSREAALKVPHLGYVQLKVWKRDCGHSTGSLYWSSERILF